MEYSLILSILASNIILCRSSNFMIMTQHLGVNDHYLEMSQIEELKVQKDFKRWDSNTKMTTCKKVIDLVSFFVLDEAEDHTFGPVPYSVNNFMSRLHLLYDLGDVDAINYTVITVNVNNVELEVPTHLCIVDSNYQVSIAQGAYNDVYFFLDKTEEMNSFRLSGIAEPKAFVHPLMNYNPKQLKIAFADSLIKQMVNGKPIRSLCPLSEYRKFRLCSLAYVAFMEQNDMKINKKMSYIRVENGRVCLRQAKLLMEAQNEFYYILTDLISCSIDTVLSKFNFYLTADPYTKDSAYILRKMRRSPSKNVEPLGDFTFASSHENNNSSHRMKEFKKKLQRPETTVLKSEETEDLMREDYATSGDLFYSLDMVVMKLTPLMELIDD